MKIKSNTHSTFNYVNELENSKSYNSEFDNINNTSLKIFKDNLLIQTTTILQSDFTSENVLVLDIIQNNSIPSPQPYILNDPQNVKTLEVRRATIEVPYLTTKLHDERSVFTISNGPPNTLTYNKFNKVQFPAIIYKVKDSEISIDFPKDNNDNSVYILYHVDYDANAEDFENTTHTYYFTILEFSQEGNFVNYKNTYLGK